jgi:hypothetical protein
VAGKEIAVKKYVVRLVRLTAEERGQLDELIGKRHALGGIASSSAWAKQEDTSSPTDTSSKRQNLLRTPVEMTALGTNHAGAV